MSNEATLKESRTDWKALATMQDEDIDLSEIPEVTAEQIDRATLRVAGKPIPRSDVPLNEIGKTRQD